MTTADLTLATPVAIEVVPQPLTDDEIATRTRDLFDLLERMRPLVQMDGGDLELVHADVVAGIVELELQGACSSCAISSTTLSAGIKRVLHERLAWVTDVRGTLDDTLDFYESRALGKGAYTPRVRPPEILDRG